MKKTIVSLSLLSACLVTALHAQQSPLDQTANLVLDKTTKARIAAYIAKKKSGDTFAIDPLVDVGFAITAMDINITKLEEQGRDYQHRRMDKIAGATAGGVATTNAVSKTGIADLFSVALENGALARTQEGTATTFRVNAYGVYSLFSPKSQRVCSIANPLCDSASELTLRGLSASLTIDNSPSQPVVPVNAQTPGSSSTTTATASPLGILRQGGRISSVGGHFDLLRRQKVDTSAYDKWRAAVGTAQKEAAALSKALANSQEFNDANKAFIKCVTDSFESQAEPDLQAKLEREYFGCLKQLYGNISVTHAGILKNIKDARLEYEAKMAQALRDLLFKPQLTVEYTHDQPANQPSLSTFRLIADLKFWGRRSSSADANGADDPQGSLTLNVGATLYETIPQGVNANKFRDVQGALQFDRKIGKVEWQNRPVVSLAGYYQYQKEKSILKFDNQSQTPLVPIPLPKPAVELLDTKGGIGIVQGKVTIPITGLISVPIAVSWANRTELLKASEVRGQFGISVDLDKLFGKSPKTP